MAGRFCLILSIIGASILLPFLLNHNPNTSGAVAAIPGAGARYFRTSDGHKSKQSENFFDEYVDALHGSPSMEAKRWQWTKRQVPERDSKASTDIWLSGNAHCKKAADIIITILSYNQALVFVIWVEACKEGRTPLSQAGPPKEFDKPLETGCDEMHPPIGLSSNDDIAVILPDMMEKIIKAMYEKYGSGCFEVYYRYAEIEWSNHWNSKQGSFNSAVTRMRPAVKVI